MGDSFQFSSRRSVVVCRNGCIASSNPLASQIGLDVLKLGGNAADAAVAVAAALNVTEPMCTGLGGDAFCMFYDNSTKTVKGINGSGRCPQALTLQKLASKGFDQYHPFPERHPLSVTVPGAASAWVDSVKQFGSGKLSLCDILQPAIDLAETGFPVQQLASYMWEQACGALQSHENIYGKDLLLNGKAPRHGDIMRNPHLAKVFKELADHGKAGFYTGRVADAIAQVVQQHGGVLTSQDLAAHTATRVDPISTDYKGFRVWELPPNGQGMTALIALNILEGSDLKSMGHNSAAYIHHLSEALRLAFVDTMHYCADPDYSSLPLEQLLSKEYAAQRRSLINVDSLIPSSKLLPEDLDLPSGSDTVYFATADSEGNACSFLNSNALNFGSGLVPEGCGFTLQSRGYGFSLNPNHRNVLAPGKRPFHTIIPSMVTSSETNELLMTYGVMGGLMQPQGHVQVLLNMCEFGLNPQAAVDAPRFLLGEGRGSVFSLNSLRLEQGTPQAVEQELKDLGHSVTTISGYKRGVFGRAQAITRGSSLWQSANQPSVDEVYWAGSDPRGDGLVAAY